MRAMFLEHRKKDLGNPVIAPPPHDPALFVRVQYLIGVESLINVGCHFGPDDLPARVWDELIAMNIERSFMDRLVDHRRETKREVDHAVEKAHQVTGLPRAGESLF